MAVIDRTFRTLEEGWEWLQQLETTGVTRVRIVVSEEEAKSLDLPVQDRTGDDVTDPARTFLDNIDDIAVDTGIEDLAHQHDHYLYGHPKRP